MLVDLLLEFIHLEHSYTSNFVNIGHLRIHLSWNVICLEILNYSTTRGTDSVEGSIGYVDMPSERIRLDERIEVIDKVFEFTVLYISNFSKLVDKIGEEC